MGANCANPHMHVWSLYCLLNRCSLTATRCTLCLLLLQQELPHLDGHRQPTPSHGCGFWLWDVHGLSPADIVPCFACPCVLVQTHLLIELGCRVTVLPYANVTPAPKPAIGCCSNGTCYTLMERIIVLLRCLSFGGWPFCRRGWK